MQEIIYVLLIVVLILMIAITFKELVRRRSKINTEVSDENIFLEGDKPSLTIKPIRPVASKVKDSDDVIKVKMANNNESSLKYAVLNDSNVSILYNTGEFGHILSTNGELNINEPMLIKDLDSGKTIADVDLRTLIIDVIENAIKENDTNSGLSE